MNARLNILAPNILRIASIIFILNLCILLYVLVRPIFILEYIPKYGVDPDPYYFDQIGLIPHSKRIFWDILGYLFALSILGSFILPPLWLFTYFLKRRVKSAFAILDHTLIAVGLTQIILIIIIFNSVYLTWFFD